MTMAKKNTRRYSKLDAIRLHAAANKSDPFASRRIAMQIARDGFKEAQDIAADSKRILDARDAAVRKAFEALKKTKQPGEVLALYPQFGRVAV